MTDPSSQDNIRVLIGTPCYGGMCNVQYTNCLINTKTFLESKGLQMGTCFLINESLIPRGRNTVVAHFMTEPTFTHLFFIDADIQWNPIDVYRLILHDKDIVGGIYPKKHYDFKKLKSGYAKQRLESTDKLTDADLAYIRANLMSYTINYSKSFEVVNGLIEVDHIATGFMMIKRKVIERMFEHYPNDKYTDDVGMMQPHQNKHLYALFDCEVYENRYLSEDYNFYRKWRNTGPDAKVYADITIKLSHIGTHQFDGNLLQTLPIGNIPGNNIEERISITHRQLASKVNVRETQSPSKDEEKSVPPEDNRDMSDGSDLPMRVYRTRMHTFTFPKNQITINNVKERVKSFMSQLPDYSKYGFGGRGIVVCSGGKYTPITSKTLRILREVHKCKLPIEWWYLGNKDNKSIESEMTESEMERIKNEIGNIEFYDASISDNPYPMDDDTYPDKLIKTRGYEIKPYALLNSSFSEILLLDADNIPLADPTDLFDEIHYKRNGNIFWLD